MLRIVQVVGARPQFVKLAPVVASQTIAAGGITEIIVHTGQHYDPSMSDSFFSELSIPAPAFNLHVGSGSHGAQTGRMLEGLERVLEEVRADRVVVYGDTNSTLAGALAAVKLHRPVVHVEAGLRSFNRRMPEEMNRIVVDHVSDLLLAPTVAAMANLTSEGLGARALLVGDVMCDAVLRARASSAARSDVLQRLGVEPGGYAVTTLHRAENTDGEALPAITRVLSAVAANLIPLVWPVHPRVRNRLGADGPVSSPRLRIVGPLGYLDMVALVDSAAVVITDSGGLQKEAFILGVPCVTLRNETEWIETTAAGANILTGTAAADVQEGVRAALGLRDRRSAFAQQARRTYGEGTAAVAIADAIIRGGAG